MPKCSTTAPCDGAFFMEKIKDIEIRKIYVEAILKNGWGRNMLSIQIDNGYHLRIGASNNNLRAFVLLDGILFKSKRFFGLMKINLLNISGSLWQVITQTGAASPVAMTSVLLPIIFLTKSLII